MEKDGKIWSLDSIWFHVPQLFAYMYDNNRTPYIKILSFPKASIDIFLDNKKIERIQIGEQ